MNQKLGLQSNSSYQAFLVDLMVNSVDLSSSGRVRALALEKFVFLTLHLDNPSFYLQFEDVKKLYLRDLEANFSGASPSVLQNLLKNEDFMLHYALASLAKNHNFFSQIDSYMKELARITIGMGAQGRHMQSRLEEALGKEIAIGNTEANLWVDQNLKVDKVKTFSPEVLAQPEWQFMPRSYKAEKVQENLNLQNELVKLRSLQDLLRLAQSDPTFE